MESSLLQAFPSHACLFSLLYSSPRRHKVIPRLQENIQAFHYCIKVVVCIFRYEPEARPSVGQPSKWPIYGHSQCKWPGMRKFGSKVVSEQFLVRVQFHDKLLAAVFCSMSRRMVASFFNLGKVLETFCAAFLNDSMNSQENARDLPKQRRQASSLRLKFLWVDWCCANVLHPVSYTHAFKGTWNWIFGCCRALLPYFCR